MKYKCETCFRPSKENTAGNQKYCQGHSNLDIKIIRIGSGWYDFKNIPQGYVKIHGLNCGSDEKAYKRAKKINSECEYMFIDAKGENV